MSQDVKRFDCTNGVAAWCQGCYTMSEDEHGDYVQAEDYDALLAEIERLRGEVEKWEAPCREFLDKTQWVQDTAKPRELGLHRADVLRQRIEQAEARAERLAEALRELVVDMERAQANMRNAAKTDPRWEGCAEAIKPRVDAARAALDQEGGNG